MIAGYIFLGLLILTIYLIVGINFMNFTYDNVSISPIYKPLIVIFWPIALIVIFVVNIYEWIVDWIEEVREYYVKDEEKENE